MPLLDRLLHRDDDDRVDGRDLVELDEPGSDALLLLGLLLWLAKHGRQIERCLDDDAEPEH